MYVCMYVHDKAGLVPFTLYRNAICSAYHQLQEVGFEIGVLCLVRRKLQVRSTCCCHRRFIMCDVDVDVGRRCSRKRTGSVVCG